MARRARVKVELDEDGIYHLRGQVACAKGEFPLQEHEPAEQLVAAFHRWADRYRCQIIGFEVMGTHYHLMVCFEAFRILARDKLLAVAELFYPGGYRPMESWRDSDWERFNRRIFDVSEFMRNLHSEYARWYNRRFNRKGHFWADRFKSAIIDGQAYLQACLFYVELNAVRAGLVNRPEVWPYSSAASRYCRTDERLMSITAIMGIDDQETARSVYRGLLLVTGAQRSSRMPGKAPEFMTNLETQHCFSTPGIFMKRHRSLSDGLVFGNRRSVQGRLDKLRETGAYSRRRHPVPLTLPEAFVLREQRRTYREI